MINYHEQPQPLVNRPPSVGRQHSGMQHTRSKGLSPFPLSPKINTHITTAQPVSWFLSFFFFFFCSLSLSLSLVHSTHIYVLILLSRSYCFLITIAFLLRFSECWFCLGSPQVEIHLVVSLGESSYLALAKGALDYDHVLLLPQEHVRTCAMVDDQTAAEIERCAVCFFFFVWTYFSL